MSGKEYLIQDLEQETGVSVRNIRYYTDEKLLPTPTYRGKQALYTPEHLKRLQLIQRMRDNHFPLSEIRAILHNLDENSLEKLLEYQDSYHQQLNTLADFKKPLRPARTTREETVAYIDSLLGKQKPETSGQVPGQLSSQGIDFSTFRQSESLPGGESWERITLAPGIELHVHQPVDPADLEHIRTLTETARTLFRKRKRGG